MIKRIHCVMCGLHLENENIFHPQEHENSFQCAHCSIDYVISEKEDGSLNISLEGEKL